MAGQTINDRLLAARHSLAGQGLAKSVCKATTEEMIGPKKKHLDYLVHCTNEPNVSIPQLANLLVERSQNANWVVVFKSLITVHHMLAYGNERFTQYLASSNSSFQLSNFLDKGSTQGPISARVGYDMSPFIRRYAKYLNEKALSYRTVAFDFCKVKRGKEEGSLRTMNAEKLLKTLPVLQAQLDCLLEFDCTPNDLVNGVINMCFMLLFRDLIRLFACYNDGIINLLEKYFDMNKKQCRDALDLYKKFLIRMDRVGEFLKVAENVGIDKGDIPDLTKAPSSLLDALEQHLASVEGKKGSAANTPTQTASNQKNVKSGVSALSSTSSAFGTVANSARLENSNGIDEGLRQQILAEEEAVLNQFKSKLQSPTNAASSTNPFLSSPVSSQPIVDLFGPVSGSSNTNTTQSKASDDLLQLGNPFADMFGAPAPAPAPAQNNMWTNGFSQQTTTTTSFVTDSNFSSVFGNTEAAAADADGTPNPFMSEASAPGAGGRTASGMGLFDNPASQLDLFSSNPPTIGNEPISSHGTGPPRPPQPAVKQSALDDLNDSIRLALGGSPSKQPPIGGMAGAPQASPARQVTGFDAMGEVLRPGLVQSSGTVAGGAPMNASQGQSCGTTQQSGGKVLTGDLDSSLASLANNLTINKSAQAQVKGVQWNSPKNSAKPGSAGWTPQPMAATTGANYRPMGQGMPLPATTSSFPLMQPMGMQGMPPMQGIPGRPMMGPTGMAGMTAPMGAPSMGTMSQMGGIMPTTQQPMAAPNNNQNQPPGNVQLDPFGIL